MGYNILVVDDSKIVRTMIIKTLRLAQVDLGKILEAGNGQQALDILEKEWIDVVFADINMPVMDGIEMIDVMARKGMLAMIPVVVVSTERSEIRIKELKSKGIMAYLTKPFTPESIHKVLHQVFQGRTAEEK